MAIFSIYIFNRNGTCLFYREWNRKKHSNMSQEEEFKLMYGMLFSLKSFVSRLSPTDQVHGLNSFKTSQYKLNFFETPSGLEIILNTDFNVGNIKDTLHQIYSQIYVEYVVKNPLCDPDKPIKSELFATKLDEYIKSLPFFSTT